MANQSPIEFIPISYQSLDGDGRINKVNQSWLDLLGYIQTQVIGRPFNDFLLPPSAARFQQAFLHLLKTGQIKNVVLTMRHATGNQLVVALDGGVEYDDQGELQQTHYLIQDVSQDTPPEDALRQLVEQFEKITTTTARQQMEASLQRTEQIINQSGVIVFLWQAQDDWPVEFVSENIRQFGYAPEAFYQRQTQFTELVHPDDWARVLAEVTHFRAAGTKEFDQEYRIVTQSGQTRWVEEHMIVRQSSNGRVTHYQGIVQDITDRKRAEAALRASETRYRHMFESHPSIQWLVDPQTQKIVDVNPAAAQFYGYTRAEMRQMAVSELNVLSPEEIAANMQYAKSQNRNYFEMPHRLASGEIRLVEIHAGPIQVNNRELLYAVLHDITERKKAEDALRQKNREMALLNQAREALNSTLDVDRVLRILLDEVCFLLDAVAGSIWLVDPVTNELVCRQVTEPQSEIVRGWRLRPGQGIAGWVAANAKSINIPDAQEDERHFKGVDQQTNLTTRSLLCVPLLLKQRAIGVIQIMDSGPDHFQPVDLSLVESLANTAAVAVENARLHEQLAQHAADLESSIKQRTQELVKANQKLTELDRLKTKLIEDISHEFRTPIANLSLYLDLLERGRPEKQPHYMAVLREKMDQLIHLTEDVLQVFRLDLYKGDSIFQLADLNDIVSEAVSACRQRIDEAGLDFVLELAERPLMVKVEPKQIQQAITNLLNNALNYTMAGTVQIITAAEPAQNKARVSVIDSGVGITAEDMPYIFDRFFRGQQVAQYNLPGTGLGLSIVQDILTLHDGQVEVDSQPDHGSHFRLWLPMATD